MFSLALFVLTFTTLVYGFDLDEVILKDIIFPGSSKCTDEGTTDFSFVHTPSPSYWDPVNANLESKKFMAQMTHTDSDPNKGWTVRFGHGGDIYSMRSGYGEAIPPQTKDFSVWVDEVTQAVAVDINQNNCPGDLYDDECYYIHQAGTYFAERTFDYLNETFYSPNVAKHCEGNTCIFASWGQIAWVPTIHKSDLIYAHQYRNCGNGVLEYTQMFIGYFGGQIAYLNMPWAGVRTSSLPDLYLSNTDFSMAPKEDTIQWWGVNDKLLTLPETGGYTTFAQNIESDPNDNAALSYVHGICEEYSDSSNNYFRAPSRFRFGMSGRDFTVFTVNGRITSMSLENSFVHRQFLINDSLGNIKAQAMNLYDEAYGDMLTPSDYNGRALEIYSLDSNTFGVAAAADLGGSGTICSRGTSVCVGSTVPTSGHVPFFIITCGSSTYFGSDKYFFAPHPDTEGRIRAYVCAGEEVGIVPKLKMLGFFPENGMCTSLQNATYDPGFCERTPNPSLSTSPSLSISPSQSPSTSMMPSVSLAPTSEYTQLYTNFLFGEFWAAPNSGIMFDIIASEDITITRFDIDLFYVNDANYGSTFPTDIEIYTKEGSYVGFEANMAVWTKHMDITSVQPPDVSDISTFGLTPLKRDILSPILIGKDTTVSVFITNRDANNFIEMAYSSSAIDYSDDTIIVKTGLFQEYEDFAANVDEDPNDVLSEPVGFSGIIYYDIGAFPSAQPTGVPSEAPSLSQVPSLSQAPSSSPSTIPSASPSGSPTISMAPSFEPSFNPSLSLSPSNSPSVSFAPSREPSSSPSGNPSVSFAPSAEPSPSPSDSPSVSMAPSTQPSISPSNTPSVSPSFEPTVVPSVAPSHDPSVAPSMEPSLSKAPSQEPTKMPTTKNPTRSPVKPPPPPPPPTTKTPTQAPNTDTLSPTTSPKPTISPTKFPTTSPTTSLVPTASPSETKKTQSPSDPRYQVITTTCSCVSPFTGISSKDLENSFAAIVALLEAAMQQILGPDRSGWGTRVVRVGNINTRRLSLFHEMRVEVNAEDSVDVEYEFSKSRKCSSVDGCNAAEQDSSINEGVAVLEGIKQSVENGELTEIVTNDAQLSGLDELSNVVVEEVEVVPPEIEIIEITAFPSATESLAPTTTQKPSVAITTEYPSIGPTSSPQTISPTFSSCSDSPFRFDVKKDGKTMKRSCSWVANHPILKCKLEGVSSHCPQTCSSCNTCADSPFKVQFMYNKKNYLRSCEWVGRKAVNKRCSIDGIFDTCRSTCGRCTSPPITAPSCYDSLDRFDVLKDGKIMRKSCSWVANHPILKCKLRGVLSHCPLTCSSCDYCIDSLLKFRVELNGKESMKSCKWVGRKAVNKRCSIGDINNTCRLTCGTCQR